MHKNKFLKDIFNTNKIINKLIITLSIILFIMITKSLNIKATNNIVSFIEKGIYYDFSIKEDGQEIGKYLMRFLNNSKENIEKLTVEIYDNIK